MKTIKQISDEIGVSKQRVARYIKTASITTSQCGSMIQLDNVAEELILKHFNKNNRINSALNNADLIQHKDQYINSLKEQLKQKDDQIDNLYRLLDQEQKLNLLTSQQNQKLQIELKEYTEKKWWKFWK